MELLTKEFGMPSKGTKTSSIGKGKSLVTTKAKIAKTTKKKALTTGKSPIKSTKASPKSKKTVVKKKPKRSLKKNQVIKVATKILLSKILSGNIIVCE